MSRHVTSLVVTSTTHVSPFTLFSLLYLSLSSPSTMHTSCPFPSETAISLLHNDEAHGEPRATRATDSSFISFSKRSFLFQPAPCFRRSSTSLFAELTRASLYSKPLSATQTLIRRLPPPSSFTSLSLACSVPRQHARPRHHVYDSSVVSAATSRNPFLLFFQEFRVAHHLRTEKIAACLDQKIQEDGRETTSPTTIKCRQRPTNANSFYGIQLYILFNYIFNYILSLIPNLRCGIKRLCYVISVKIFRCVSRYFQ